MENEVRYSYATIDMAILRWIGMLISWGVPPVHTRIYWRLNDQCWMSELTSDTPVPNCVDVGSGDGYTIQITRVPELIGTKVECPHVEKLDAYARSYASIEKGNLSYRSDLERNWYAEPQGYGGPLYDRCTSNTYAAWLMRQSGCVMPAKPKGGIGWDEMPSFPGPKHYG